MQYSQVRVKFEGEDGSGPGVNRGFFASFAAALKNPAKVSYVYTRARTHTHTHTHAHTHTRAHTHTHNCNCYTIGMPQGWSTAI